MLQTLERITIPAPDLRTLEVDIAGTAPLLIAKFSQKAKLAIRGKQEAGGRSRKGQAKDARNFEADFQGARHLSAEGWDGIAAPAFRAAMISACRLVGFKMTIAKLSVFVLADGLDAEDGTPLIRIIGGEPEMSEMMVRNATGVVDIRVRPMWRAWGARLRLRYDAAQFSSSDVVNLLHRAGAQVGVGEGRPDSKSSAGMGYGTFRVSEG
jgi:hypothetical protein